MSAVRARVQDGGAHGAYSRAEAGGMMDHVTAGHVAILLAVVSGLRVHVRKNGTWHFDLEFFGMRMRSKD